MTLVRTDAGREVLVLDDDCVVPWVSAPTVVVLLHGIGESGKAWYAFVPRFLPTYRVIRPDLLSLCSSSDDGIEWTLDALASELRRLLFELRIDDAHIVGRGVGADLASVFAAEFPECTRSVSVVGDAPVVADAASLDEWKAAFATSCVGPTPRTGELAWWRGLADSSSPVVINAMRTIERPSERSDSSSPTHPILVLTSDDLGVDSSSGEQLAVVWPDACSEHVYDFIVNVDQSAVRSGVTATASAATSSTIGRTNGIRT